ncbi:MAG: SDR family oxidoreductase [Anaerolineales bacterium]|nr:SDR family oxidoreductase [Anaerolineales bacterium]
MATPRALSELISLKGKRALITGAAAGIGKAIACRFAEAGADLELVDIDNERLAATRKELERFGTEVNIHETNISKQEEIDRLWDKLSGDGPDILVNNAGIYPFKEFLDVDESFYKRVLETNLDSVYWMCQKMIGRRLKLGGVIVNVGSIEAIVAFKEDLAHYSVSKAGVIALTRSLAKEHGKHGFRINAVVPGGIITSGTKRAAKGIFRFDLGLIRTGIEFKQRLPIGRLGRPDEVACMALVLASDLSSYVHGAAIPVDGGFLAV